MANEWWGKSLLDRVAPEPDANFYYSNNQQYGGDQLYGGGNWWDIDVEEEKKRKKRLIDGEATDTTGDEWWAADVAEENRIQAEKRNKFAAPVEQPVEPVQKERPFFGVSDTISALGQAAVDVVKGAPATYYSLSEGFNNPTKYSPSAKAAFAAERERNAQQEAERMARESEGTETSVGSAIRQAGKSLDFSLANMAVAIPAGAATGAAAGALFPPAEIATIPIATGAAMVGAAISSGPVAYRMAGNQFLRDAFADIEQRKGSPLTEDESDAAYKTLLPLAQDSGLWEAGPEAIGNAVSFGVGKFLFGFGKDAVVDLATKALAKSGVEATKASATDVALKALTAAGRPITQGAVDAAATTVLKEASKTTLRKATEKTVAALGDLGVELGGETITQKKQGFGQAQAEQYAKTGSTQGAVNQYEGLAGLAKAFGEVGPATLATTALMGGLAGGVKVATSIAPNNRADIEKKFIDLIALSTKSSAIDSEEIAPETSKLVSSQADVEIRKSELDQQAEEEKKKAQDALAAAKINLEALSKAAPLNTGGGPTNVNAEVGYGGGIVAVPEALKRVEERQGNPVEQAPVVEGKRIEAAAFMAPDNTVYYGKDHLEAMGKALEAGKITQEEIDAKQEPASRETKEFGFSTDVDPFIGRSQAEVVATGSGQKLVEKPASGLLHSNEVAQDAFPQQKVEAAPPVVVATRTIADAVKDKDTFIYNGQRGAITVEDGVSVFRPFGTQEKYEVPVNPNQNVGEIEGVEWARKGQTRTQPVESKPEIASIVEQPTEVAEEEVESSTNDFEVSSTLDEIRKSQTLNDLADLFDTGDSKVVQEGKRAKKVSSTPEFYSQATPQQLDLGKRLIDSALRVIDGSPLSEEQKASLAEPYLLLDQDITNYENNPAHQKYKASILTQVLPAGEVGPLQPTQGQAPTADEAIEQRAKAEAKRLEAQPKPAQPVVVPPVEGKQTTVAPTVSGLPPIETYEQVQAKQRDAQEKFRQYAEEQRIRGATEEQINEARQKQLQPALDKIESDWRSATETAATEWADSVDPFNLPQLPENLREAEAKIFGEKLLQRLAKDLGVTEDNTVTLNATTPDGRSGTVRISMSGDGEVRAVSQFGEGAARSEGFGFLDFVTEGFNAQTGEATLSRVEPIKLQQPVTPTTLTVEQPKITVAATDTAAADAAVEGVRQLGEVNPLNEKQIVSNGVKIEVERQGQDLNIKDIYSPEQGLGKGTEVLNSILKVADDNGVAVVVTPQPTGTTTEQQLRKWYSDNGFVDHTQGRMIRLPTEAAIPKVTPEERIAKLDRLKQIKDEIDTIQFKPVAGSEVGLSGLTTEEAQKYSVLMMEAEGIRLDLRKELKVEKIKSEKDRKSAIPPDIIKMASDELASDRGVWSAITEAAVGTFKNMDTAVDIVMDGKNPDVSPNQLYNAFNNTREALRYKFGDTITLYRAVGKQKPKATTNWLSTKEAAMDYGKNVVEKDVPIDDIVALNVGLTGRYEEFIVGQKPAKPVVAPPVEGRQTVVNDVEYLASVERGDNESAQRFVDLAFRAATTPETMDLVFERHKNFKMMGLTLEEIVQNPEALAKKDKDDYDTVMYWVSQIQQGNTPTVVADEKGFLWDGFHRLVASKIAGGKTLNVFTSKKETSTDQLSQTISRDADGNVIPLSERFPTTATPDTASTTESAPTVAPVTPPVKKPLFPKLERFNEKYINGIRPDISNRLDFDTRYSDIITEAAGRKLSKEQEVEVIVEWLQRKREQGEVVLWNDFGSLSMDQAYMVEPALVNLGLLKPSEPTVAPSPTTAEVDAMVVKAQEERAANPVVKTETDAYGRTVTLRPKDILNKTVRSALRFISRLNIGTTDELVLQDAAAILAESGIPALDKENIVSLASKNIKTGRSQRFWGGDIGMASTKKANISEVIHEVGHSLTADQILKHAPRMGEGGGKEYIARLNAAINNKATPEPVSRLFSLYTSALDQLGIADVFGEVGGVAGQFTADMSQATAKSLQAQGRLRTDLDSSQLYGLANVEEFVSQAWSSPAFRDLLKTLKAPDGKRSMWSAFVDAIKQVLNLPNNTMAAAVIEASFDIGMEVKGKRGRRGRVQPAPQSQAAIKLDADYLAAVERGDLETAQKMVDDAARAAGYIHQGLKHGSGARFTQFLQSFRGTAAGGISSNEAFFLTDSERTAKSYAVHASEEGPVKQLMRKAEEAESQGDWDSYESLIAQAEDMTYGEEGAIASAERRKNAVVYNLFVRGKFMSVDAGGKTAEEFGSLTAKINEARRKGLDGVIFKNLDDAPNLNDPSTHYAVFAPENIKSSDAVTYDEQGNVIPLSERFNPEEANINYAPQPDIVKQETEAESNTIDAMGEVLQNADSYSYSIKSKKPIMLMEDIIGQWFETIGGVDELRESIIENTHLDFTAASTFADAIFNQYNIQKALIDLRQEVEARKVAQPSGETRPYSFVETAAAEIHKEDKSKIQKVYEVLSNDVSSSEATEALNALTLDQALGSVKDMANGMKLGVRTMMAQITYKRLMEERQKIANEQGNRSQDYIDIREKHVDMFDWMSEYGKDLGQGIQAFAKFADLGPDGIIRHYEKTLKKIIKTAKQKYTKTINKLQKAISDGDMASFSEALTRNKQGISNMAEKMVKAEIAPQIKDSPVSQKTIDQFVNQRAKQLGVSLTQQFNKWYKASKDGRITIEQSLKDALMEDVNIPEADVARLASRIVNDFKNKAEERRKRVLAKFKAPKIVVDGVPVKQTKLEKLFELINMGVITDEEAYGIIADKYKLPQYSTEFADRLYKAAQELQGMPDQLRKKLKTRDIMAMIAKEKGFSPSELGTGFIYANMLSSPDTHIVNVIDTLINVFASGVADAIVTRDMSRLEGIVKGYKKGWVQAVDTFKTGLRIGMPGFEAQDLQVLESNQFGVKGGVHMSEFGVVNQITKAILESKPAGILNYAKYVGRLLEAQDAANFSASQEGQRYADAALKVDIDAKESGTTLTKKQRKAEIAKILNSSDKALVKARQQAIAEGYTGTDAEYRAIEITEDKIPEEIREGGFDRALKDVYRQKPMGTAGALADTFFNFINQRVESPLARSAIKLTVSPFVVTPVNIFNKWLDWSPYGFKRMFWGSGNWMSEKYKVEAYEKGSIERRVQMVKASSSVLVMGAVYALVKAGVIALTGRGPNDEEERKKWLGDGHKPYRLEVGGKAFNFTLTPWAIPLSVMANYLNWEKYKMGDEASAMERMVVATMFVPSITMELPFMSGVGDLFDLINPRSQASAEKRAEKFIGGKVGMFFPNAFRYIDRLFDPTVYKSNGIRAMFLDQTPFVRKYGGKLLNLFGDQIGEGKSMIERLSGRVVSFPQPSLASQIVEKFDAYPYIESPTKESVVTHDKQGTPVKVPMTQEQYEKFAVGVGRDFKQYILSNYDMNREYSEKEKEYIKKNILKVYSDMRKMWRRKIGSQE